MFNCMGQQSLNGRTSLHNGVNTSLFVIITVTMIIIMIIITLTRQVVLCHSSSKGKHVQQFRKSIAVIRLSYMAYDSDI